MSILFYVEKLKSIIPEDNKINTQNVSDVFNKINKGSSFKLLLRSEMMLISIITLIKILYCDKLINLKSTAITWINNTSTQTNSKPQNIISTEMQYKNEAITRYIFESRKTLPNLNYYQSFNTYDSLIRRFNIMNQFGDTSEKRIVFLGDDELFSLFYALNSNSYKQILVLDIDENILEEIDRNSSLYNLNIQTRKFDIFSEGTIDAQYDVFFASGLKKLAGLLMFIFTGTKFLNLSDNASGYFTYYPYVDKLNKIDKQQNEYNFNLQKTLHKYGFFLDHLSVCDEIQISDSLVEKSKEWINKDNNLIIKNDDECFKSLAKDEELAADPLLPYFSIKPINIAHIKPIEINMKEIDNYLKMIRRFRQ